MDTRVLHKGEVFERVFVDESVDLHLVQEAGSRVKIVVLTLPNEITSSRDQVITNRIFV